MIQASNLMFYHFSHISIMRIQGNHCQKCSQQGTNILSTHEFTKNPAENEGTASKAGRLGEKG